MTLRVGVLSFAHTHAISYLGALAAMPDVEVRGTDPGGVSTGTELGDLRGAELARALGAGYADSVDELLAWGPDAVIVTSENARHREFVELAVAAGAHVLCEKPLATSWQDGLAIREAVDRAGVLLMMAFPVRFALAFDRLRATRDSGALGTVFSVRGANNGMLPLARWFTDVRLSGGGALVDHVVHVADLIDGLTGAAPVSVTAVANRVLHADRANAETAGLVTITYDDGTIAAIDCSWSRPDTSPVWGGLTLDVAGTGGTVSVDFFGAAARGLDAVGGRPIELRYGPDHDLPMLRTFLAAVKSGEQPQPDVGVGRRTLSIVLAAQQSVRTGTIPVQVAG
ncbi:Gfo/Idh/MocA family oxidoreductase [Curtobacterium flaccumfaciens]|uniref:Gfo/Idh/MocA family protein n=1 Tax=Curtobacterium flaccumfaciens TaxID=2035 RepID=UPI0021C99552|nr:Gfo/Idh/MocA family oxidoreductase [Curtobacterium flaccumfaciens]UXN23377.1 Gfo/Idh/MocA family oxidoreductase [Curtobacterium flaccumfaciens pv. flaccumfaciens]